MDAAAIPADTGCLSRILLGLKESSRCRDVNRGRQLHSWAIDSGLVSNPYVANSLINMYAKCGSMIQARAVFDSLAAVDVVSWTALITGYVGNDGCEMAVELFDLMGEDGQAKPNVRTYVAVLSACAALAAREEDRIKLVGRKKQNSNKWLSKGKSVHVDISLASGGCCWDNVFVQNKLVDLYARCGCMRMARSVFDAMRRPTVVSWTAVMQGYVNSGQSEVALELFDAMGCLPDARAFAVALSACTALGGAWVVKGKEIHSRAVEMKCCSIFVESSGVDMFAKCGDMVSARKVFDKMARRNVVSWTALIMGYVQSGDSHRALESVCEMKRSGVAPNATTYAAALTACGNLMAADVGEGFRQEIVSAGLEQDVVVANSLVDLYAKCGNVEAAKEIFDSMSCKTVVSWTALMGAYSLKGDTARVFQVFEAMREQGRPAPDGVTFVCLLTACSHAGLTDRGREYFDAMKMEYGLNPGMKHYACMVDLLSRANCLDEALLIMENMPFESDAVMWKAVLGGCAKWKNVVVGRMAFESLLRLDDKDDTAYVLMASIYRDSRGDVNYVSSISNELASKTMWIEGSTGILHNFTNTPC